MAVLLDANTLPQFALIGSAALWILSVSVTVPPLLLVLVPFAGIVSSFLFLDRSSNANAYFFDVWANTDLSPWRFPQSFSAATALGRVFSLGLVVTLVLAIAIRIGARRSQWGPAFAGGACLCTLMVLWALEPGIWATAVKGAPSQSLPDFGPFVSTRHGQLTQEGTGQVLVSYPEALIAAARQGSVNPESRLTITGLSLFSNTGATKALPVLDWGPSLVTVANWPSLSPSIQEVWVQVLLGSSQWSVSSPPQASSIRLLANGSNVPADSARLIAYTTGLTGWALVNFRLPAAAIKPQGSLVMEPGPSILAVEWLRQRTVGSDKPRRAGSLTL